VLFNVPTLASPAPLVLSPTDTVFYSFFWLIFRLTFKKTKFFDDFLLSSQLVSEWLIQLSFGVQLKAKYAVAIDTLNDGFITVFIYNKLDFQNLYIRLDYKVITYSNLVLGSGSNIVQTYTASFIPASTDNILFGFNGMEHSGYPTIGF